MLHRGNHFRLYSSKDAPCLDVEDGQHHMKLVQERDGSKKIQEAATNLFPATIPDRPLYSDSYLDFDISRRRKSIPNHRMTSREPSTCELLATCKT